MEGLRVVCVVAESSRVKSFKIWRLKFFLLLVDFSLHGSLDRQLNLFTAKIVHVEMINHLLLQCNFTPIT
jgi:hypothetical protein